MLVFLTNSESLARAVNQIGIEHAATSAHVYALDSMTEIESWPQ